MKTFLTSILPQAVLKKVDAAYPLRTMPRMSSLTQTAAWGGAVGMGVIWLIQVRGPKHGYLCCAAIPCDSVFTRPPEVFYMS